MYFMQGAQIHTLYVSKRFLWPFHELFTNHRTGRDTRKEINLRTLAYNIAIYIPLLTRSHRSCWFCFSYLEFCEFIFELSNNSIVLNILYDNIKHFMFSLFHISNKTLHL